MVAPLLIETSNGVRCEFTESEILEGVSVPVPTRDVVGYKLKSTLECTITLTIYYYQLLENKKRERNVLELIFGIGYESKLREYMEDILKSSKPSWQSKPLLFILNPHSGAKLGELKFKYMVEPMFEEAELDFQLLKTSHRGHAKEMVSNINVNDYGAIAVGSGDGTLQEVIAGLMSHTDWESAMKMPLGIVPLGTSNGIAENILQYRKEMNRDSFVLNAAFTILKGNPISIDMLCVKTKSNKVHFGILGFGYGFVNDVDILSDTMRFMGAFRYTFKMIQQLIKNQPYSGNIYYISSDDGTDLPGLVSKDGYFTLSTEQISDKSTLWKQFEHKDLFSFYCMNTSSLGDNFIMAPDAWLGDGKIYISVMTGPMSRTNVLRLFPELDKGGHLKDANFHCIPAKAFRFEVSDNDQATMGLDGEEIDRGTIRGEVLAGMANLIM